MSDVHQKALALDRAYREGDLEGVRRLLGHPSGFPNCEQPFELGCGGTPLEYAFCWSPQSLIYDLLRLGADANYSDDDGFPPLFTLLASDREDKYELMTLILDHGADVCQRGFNDWTPLHYAVAQRDIEAVTLLLRRGADPHRPTRIDDGNSPLEDAVALGFDTAVAVMKEQGISEPDNRD